MSKRKTPKVKVAIASFGPDEKQRESACERVLHRYLRTVVERVMPELRDAKDSCSVERPAHPTSVQKDKTNPSSGSTATRSENWRCGYGKSIQE